MELKDTLRLLIKQRETSVGELAESTGIAAGTIKTWLRGSAPRSMRDVRTIARHFNVSMEYLLFGEDEALPRTVDELPLEDLFSGWLKVKVQRAIPTKRKGGKGE